MTVGSMEFDQSLLGKVILTAYTQYIGTVYQALFSPQSIFSLNPYNKPERLFFHLTSEEIEAQSK
jgi:hypothetical protein